MRGIRGSLVIVVSLVSLVCLGLAFAQMSPIDGSDQNGRPSRDEVRARIFNRLVEKLGLTDEQADALKAILKDHDEAMEEIKEAGGIVLRAIRAELAEETPNEDVLALLITQSDTIRARLRTEMETFRVKTDAFRSGLTVTQQAQFLLIQARLYMRMHGPGPRWGATADEAPVEACPPFPPVD